MLEIFYSFYPLNNFLNIRLLVTTLLGALRIILRVGDRWWLTIRESIMRPMSINVSFTVSGKYLFKGSMVFYQVYFKVENIAIFIKTWQLSKMVGRILVHFEKLRWCDNKLIKLLKNLKRRYKNFSLCTKWLEFSKFQKN